MSRFLVLCLFLALGCSGKRVTTEEDKDTATNEDRKQNTGGHNKNLLEGVWALNDTTVAFFSIRNDSVYYVDELDNPVPYYTTGDTLVINYGNFLTKDLIIKLNKDSLVIKDESDHVIKLYRR